MVTWRCTKVGLDLDFFKDVDTFLSDSPFTWVVLDAFRTRAQQQKRYNDWIFKVPGAGKAAPPGYSAHESGLAIDVVLDVSPETGLQPSWNIKLAGWVWLKTASIKHPRLKNGWSFGDWPHIERYKWQRYVK